METLRKVTFGELAEIADTPAETVRSRLKRTLSVEASRGWARFDAIQVLYIAGYCKSLSLLQHPEMALKSAEFIAESYMNLIQIPPRTIKRSGQLSDDFLVFDYIESGLPQPFLREKWYHGKDQLADALQFYTDRSAFADGAAFSVINVATVSDWILDRLFDLQGIEGDEAKGAKK